MTMTTTGSLGDRRWLLAGTALLAMLGAGTAFAQDAAPNQANQPDPAAPAQSGVGGVAADSNVVAAVTIIAPAMHVAPANIPLDVVQPTSTVPSGFIANNIIPLASYDDVIKFQTSVWSQNPNGPGIGKFETLTLRGFQDDQYNVTFDGIPFGDATDLHHTSSALFIAHDLQEAEVDRGPGTASTLGNATFGGTIGFRTKDGTPDAGINPYFTYGSFNTKAEGLELNSGKTLVGDGYIDFNHEETDGYLTHSNELRSNLMLKDRIDINPDTTLTLLGSYNHEFQYTTQGATLAEYAQFGDNYGLCNNPALQCDYKYQPSDYYSDFEYIKLQTKAFGWLKINDTIYTDGFGHSYTESTDASQENASANGVTFYSTTNIGKKVATDATDVPGKLTEAGFRAFGNILNFSAETPFGEAKAGFWIDRNSDARFSESVDLTQGGIPVPGKTGNPYSYNFKDVTYTYQPYIEFDYKPFPGLVITPGVRYSDDYRRVDAIVNKTTKTPYDNGKDFHSLMPSIAANYTITQGWTAYAQAAKGFLAPGVSVFQVQDPQGLRPESTWNYQIGTAVRRPKWFLGADVYDIVFSNYLSASEINVPGIGQQSTFANGGGAVYEGIEAEGQYALGRGFSLYGNYSINTAHYAGTQTVIAEAPKDLAALGLLYDNRKGPYFSVIGKWNGEHYGLDSTTNAAGATVFQDQYKIQRYITADFAGGWNFKNVIGPLRGLSPSVKVSNIFNNRSISDFAGNQSATSAQYPNGAPTYWRAAGRSVFFNLTAVVF
jgi:iron complex outermembrane receptor protein